MSLFAGRVALTPIGMRDGDRWYETIEPFAFHSQLYGATIKVPVGFQTDMASVPRTFQIALQKDGGIIEAALVHDYLYSISAKPLGFSRRDADRIFLEAMTVAGMGPIKRGWAYNAVRWFGGRTYQKR